MADAFAMVAPVAQPENGKNRFVEEEAGLAAGPGLTVSGPKKAGLGWAGLVLGAWGWKAGGLGLGLGLVMGLGAGWLP